MDLIGKSKWWGAALSAIQLWDNKKESLDIKISLPDSESPNETLRTLFDKVVNYIYFDFADRERMTIINDGKYVQTAFLKPGGYFEFLKKDIEGNKIQKIIKNEFAVGCFEAEALKSLLADAETKEAIQHSVCLITSCITTSDAHAIALRFIDANWQLYDPSGKISKFDENDYIGLLRGINEAFRRNKNDIFTIEIASSTDCNLSKFKAARNKLIATADICEINRTDKLGLTALHRAVYYGNMGLVQYLIEHHANVDAGDSDGNTVLHYAVQDGNFKLVQYLVEHNANVNARNENRCTALDYCIKIDILNLFTADTLKNSYLKTYLPRLHSDKEPCQEFMVITIKSMFSLTSSKKNKKCILFALLKVYQSDLSARGTSYNPTIFGIDVPTEWVPEVLLGVSQESKRNAVDDLIKAMLNNTSLDDVYTEHSKALNQGKLGEIYSELRFIEDKKLRSQI
jgi:hypothetical protein